MPSFLRTGHRQFQPLRNRSYFSNLDLCDKGLLRSFNGLCQFGDRWVLKERRKRQFDAHSLADSQHDSNGKERIAAELEKADTGIDVLSSKHLLPDFRHFLGHR